jgi:hypothetical protein
LADWGKIGWVQDRLGATCLAAACLPGDPAPCGCRQHHEKIGKQIFRAPGITVYPKNKGMHYYWYASNRGAVQMAAVG